MQFHSGADGRNVSCGEITIGYVTYERPNRYWKSWTSDVIFKGHPHFWNRNANWFVFANLKCLLIWLNQFRPIDFLFQPDCVCGGGEGLKWITKVSHYYFIISNRYCKGAILTYCYQHFVNFGPPIFLTISYIIIGPSPPTR